jgi:ferredoxin
MTYTFPIKMKVNKSKCLYCGGCVGICPVQALELKETVLQVDEKKCTKCLLCVKFCPVGAIRRDD